MPTACPECGSDVPVAARTIPALAGTCPSCSREVLLLSPGTTPIPGLVAPEPEREQADRTVTAMGASIPHPGDDDCDGTVQLELSGAGRLVGACSECGEEIVFMLRGEDNGDDAPRPRDRDDSAPPRDRDRRGPRRDFAPRGSAPPSQARPCRQCGGPLAFETGADGTVTGRCNSCGNTFSLAPRRDRGGDRYGSGPPRGRSGGGGGGWRPRPGGRRFDRPRDGGDDDRPKRRFRRRDD